jgi:hypothetical protein
MYMNMGSAVHVLTLSNPIFLPPHTPQLLFILGGREVGGLLVIIRSLKTETERVQPALSVD